MLFRSTRAVMRKTLGAVAVALSCRMMPGGRKLNINLTGFLWRSVG